MRILLLHPEDSPVSGPWSLQRWDLIVDLGRSSTFSTTAWERQTKCRVVRLDSFRRPVEDLRLVRELFEAGRHRLVDKEGLDWWDLTSLLIGQEAEIVLSLRRLALDLDRAGEVWATRDGWPAGVVAGSLGTTLRTFSRNSLVRAASKARHYAELSRKFSVTQIKEIFLDKYDADYAWRSRVAGNPPIFSEQVVLIPSAYGNVSRMAAAYARLLPEQSFLLVATRHSARQFEPQSNICVRDFAGYVKGGQASMEEAGLQTRWKQLRNELCEAPEFQALAGAGILDLFPKWIHDGLQARAAWSEVLEREPVCAVLCGDDSNLFTRLPVLLATKRKIPTVDFHHGAFDGRYLLKDLPCDIYLTKNEMERDYLVRVCQQPADRIIVGAPAQPHACAPTDRRLTGKDTIVFFSEPYENLSMRPGEVYRELLPSLCRLGKEHGYELVIKLHPFESLSMRRRMVRDILSPEDHATVTLLDGPLSTELLKRAWFGITAESTTVIDCAVNGVPCFLCGWISLSTYGYLQQYERYGVGEVLRDVDEVGEIPRRIATRGSADRTGGLWRTIDPDSLRQWLTHTSSETVDVRRIC